VETRNDAFLFPNLVITQVNPSQYLYYCTRTMSRFVQMDIPSDIGCYSLDLLCHLMEQQTDIRRRTLI